MLRITNAPQCFGYISKDPTETKQHLFGLGDFFTTMKAKKLPSGGVFYLRGGYGNLDGFGPEDPDATTRPDFQGNDDHPAYSDAQISEALLADEVNAIAARLIGRRARSSSSMTRRTACTGHTTPRIRDFDALGHPLDQGPRIPMIVLSPYGVVHAVSHERTEHGSLIKLINELFNLTPWGGLPDEVAARELGAKKFGQRTR